ncbi:MAG: universal stress protein [Tissierellales bacterium]|nr:universal stress protein [Tissierellales bacterium]
MKKILMPVERYQNEYDVIDAAVEIAKNCGSTITLFYVDNSKVVFSQMQNDTYVDIEKIMTTMKDDDSTLESIAEKYNEKGIKTEVKEVVGDPAAEIINEAENGDYDLIIMRTHGMKATRRFLMGSVTNKVVHHINKPILVVR